MQILTHTDGSLNGSEELAGQVESMVRSAVDRFSDRITTVQVHLSDENAGKGGAADKRCMIEARLEGLRPIAVTHEAPSLELAMTGAADKLERSIQSTLGRLDDR